ncbi:hypothetical protein CB1_000951017 [Camelus ferus]|nr:hypothetical protein CB1_000951017 [Camelus ferus]
MDITMETKKANEGTCRILHYIPALPSCVLSSPSQGPSLRSQERKFGITDHLSAGPLCVLCSCRVGAQESAKMLHALPRDLTDFH